MADYVQYNYRLSALILCTLIELYPHIHTHSCESIYSLGIYPILLPYNLELK
jgi:hypothetical protein